MLIKYIYYIIQIKQGGLLMAIKYFLYARKSSEEEDRQVASIESQVVELKAIAEREGHEIAEIFSEAKSAKAPGRPKFLEMIEKIKKGEAEGLLCWKLDRLARNPIDGGTIQWTLQEGIVKHIRTHEKSYYSKDNVLLMCMEFGMAAQFIRDLSANTKRGLLSKAERGLFPGKAPLGYINEQLGRQGERRVLKDSARFDLVRKVWDLLLDKKYSAERIYKIAVNDWGLSLRNGKKPCHGIIYWILNNPFYYGYFNFKNKLYKGNHEPMITEQEFNLGQEILGNRMKPQPKSHVFAFTGLMRCGECGAMITAEEKTKHQKNGNTHHYTYYRCTKRKDPNCSQTPIKEEGLSRQISEVLERIRIPQEFHEWAMKQLRLENEQQADSRKIILNNQRKAYDDCLKQLDTLIDMRTRDILTDDEFTAKKDGLNKEKAHFQGLLNDTNSNADKWLETAENVFNFARDAKNRFENGTMEDRRQILSCLGLNLSLKDKILTVELRNPLFIVEEMALGVKEINSRFVPAVARRQVEQNYTEFIVKGR